MKTANSRTALKLALVAALAALLPAVAPAKQIGINVVLNTEMTDAVLADISNYGTVTLKLPQIRGLTLKADDKSLSQIRSLSYVRAAVENQAVTLPVDDETGDKSKEESLAADSTAATTLADAESKITVDSFRDGINTWDLDAINVTEFGVGRIQPLTGEGVYVALLDSGLVKNWRSYFPEARIATEYAIAFGGGGSENANVSTQPNKWGNSAQSHGTQVASAIIGYAFPTGPDCEWTKWFTYQSWHGGDQLWAINGAAPDVKIIPVNITGGGPTWASVVQGLIYVADLKKGPLATSPVVVNMSLQGDYDPLFDAAVNYAADSGVVLVAAAGNFGNQGVKYPGAFERVISVGAASWVEAWTPDLEWWLRDVPENQFDDLFLMAPNSSRALPGQDLDVVAPGMSFGPRESQHGKMEYQFVFATSHSTPRVAGIVALMLQKNPGLTTDQVETILQLAAEPLAANCANYLDRYWTPGAIGLQEVQTCWDGDATGAGFIAADRALALTPNP